MLGYADQVKAAVDGYWARAARVVIGTIEEAASRLIDRSPIGAPETWKRGKAPAGYVPGQFVSNWNLGVNGCDNSLTSATNIRVVNGLERIPAEPFGARYFISNASPQAWRIEVEGWSKQAPSGVVGVTALEFPNIVAEAEARAKATGQGVQERYE